MLEVDEMASVVGRSINSNVTFSTVEFSTSYDSNVVNGILDDAISTIVSLVFSANWKDWILNLNCHQAFRFYSFETNKNIG